MYQSGNVMHALTENFIGNIYSCVQTYMLIAGFFVTGKSGNNVPAYQKLKNRITYI